MEGKEANSYKETENPQVETEQGREDYGRVGQEIIS